MNRFLEKHQSKLIAALIFGGVAALIWMDEHKHRVALGTAAPNVTFQMLDGSPDVSLASLRGQPVVLDFWATWCPPCRASLPHIAELAKKYEGKAHVIAVNAEGEQAALQKHTLEQLRVSLPVATNGAQAAAAYHVEGLPTTVVLDREGKVVETFTGAVASSRIERVLEGLK